jgi:hypothetical protein
MALNCSKHLLTGCRAIKLKEFKIFEGALRSSLHAGERTVRHALAELMHEQQTTTHTLTNTLNTLSLMVRAGMLRIRGLKVLGNTQMFCIIEFHFIDLSLRIFNTKFVLL